MLLIKLFLGWGSVAFIGIVFLLLWLVVAVSNIVVFDAIAANAQDATFVIVFLFCCHCWHFLHSMSHGLTPQCNFVIRSVTKSRELQFFENNSNLYFFRRAHPRDPSAGHCLPGQAREEGPARRNSTRRLRRWSRFVADKQIINRVIE